MTACWRILIFKCNHRQHQNQHQNQNGNQSQKQRHSHSHRHWQLIFKFISHLWTECVHYQQALCSTGDDNARAARSAAGGWRGGGARPDCASIRHARCTRERTSKSIGDNYTMGPKGNILTADCLSHCTPNLPNCPVSVGLIICIWLDLMVEWATLTGGNHTSQRRSCVIVNDD